MKRLLLCITLATGTMLGPPAYADNKPCRGEDACQDRGSCYESEAECSDDDFNFDESQLIICLPQSECHFEGRRA